MPPPSAAMGFAPVGRLVRPRSPRVIAGVCSGLAQHYGWDLTVIRLVTVVVTVFTGVGLLVYLAAWIIIPDGQYALATPVQAVPLGAAPPPPPAPVPNTQPSTGR